MFFNNICSAHTKGENLSTYLKSTLFSHAVKFKYE